MILIYGNDLNLVDRYNNSLKKYKYKIIEKSNELFENSEEDNIIIMSNISFSKENLDLINLLVNKKRKVIILDPIPSYKMGKKLVSIGIKAYANMMINNIHLKDVIKTVKDGNIWLYPDFINNLVLNIAKKSELSNKRVEFELLTPREKEIANLVLKKKTYLNIADELKISLRTVKTHTKKIYEKLNVKSRVSFILEFA